MSSGTTLNKILLLRFRTPQGQVLILTRHPGGGQPVAADSQRSCAFYSPASASRPASSFSVVGLYHLSQWPFTVSCFVLHAVPTYQLRLCSHPHLALAQQPVELCNRNEPPQLGLASCALGATHTEAKDEQRRFSAAQVLQSAEYQISLVGCYYIA